MNMAQKLEVGCGTITLVTSSIFFYVSIMPFIRSENDSSHLTQIGIRIFALIMLPALLTTAGSIAHATRKSRIGLIALLLGGTILTLYFGVMLFSFAIFYYFGWIGGLFAAMPGVFAFLTIVLAIRPQILDRNAVLT